MSVKLDNVAIITGAAGGLGSVMSLALLEAGARVAAADIPASATRMAALLASAERIGARDRIFPVYGDVSSYDDCQTMVAATVEQFGAVHVLVNNAALFINSFTEHVLSAPPPFTEMPLEMWPKIIGINVNGPFYMARAVAPHFLAQKWGRIVNVVTSYGTMVRGGVSPYGQSKAALEAATSIWSADLAGTGVTVNAILPGGAADTSMIPLADRADRSTLVKPSVMAAPIVWLASRDSDGTTGRRIIGKDWDPAAPFGTPAAWRTD
jgi:3-oxoacyl-[acyl-carrier protein] reductase